MWTERKMRIGGEDSHWRGEGEGKRGEKEKKKARGRPALTAMSSLA